MNTAVLRVSIVAVMLVTLVLALSVPMASVMALPLFMCAGGMCPEDQRISAWAILAIVPVAYIATFWLLEALRRKLKALLADRILQDPVNA